MTSCGGSPVPDADKRLLERQYRALCGVAPQSGVVDELARLKGVLRIQDNDAFLAVLIFRFHDRRELAAGAKAIERSGQAAAQLFRAETEYARKIARTLGGWVENSPRAWVRRMFVYVLCVLFLIAAASGAVWVAYDVGRYSAIETVAATNAPLAHRLFPGDGLDLLRKRELLRLVEYPRIDPGGWAHLYRLAREGQLAWLDQRYGQLFLEGRRRGWHWDYEGLLQCELAGLVKEPGGEGGGICRVEGAKTWWPYLDLGPRVLFSWPVAD